ncbi:peptidase dimerization domain-containing protein [Desulfolithobacter sp.]
MEKTANDAMTSLVMEKILDQVRKLPQALEPYREMLLANVVMIGEIPGPTFGEENRVNFLVQRFTECGLQNCSTDEAGNGLAILPGTDGDKSILVSAHSDTPFPATIDHTYTVSAGKIRGPGVADDILGLAVLATLPTVLEGLGLRFSYDIVLMGATRSLDMGNQSGLRFFLANTDLPLKAGIAVEGASLGRLHFRSMASLGGTISCHVDRKVSQRSAIDVLNQIITKLREIDMPQESNTALILGSVSGGASYKVPARNARLKFQLRSDSDEIVREITGRINRILDEMALQAGVSAHLEVIARTRSGGISSSHPLVVQTRRIMAVLGIEPRYSIYSSIMSGYVEHELPALGVGITNADNVNYEDEFVEIEPIMTGVAQLIGILLAIDGGCCV